jgi:DNA replication protein DnaC
VSAQQKSERIRQLAEYLRLTLLRNDPLGPVHKAQIDNPGYLDYTLDLLDREVRQRQKTDLERRLRLARLPLNHDLDRYDHSFANGLGRQQLAQLRQLVWLEQNFNLVLMGPSGTGKTFVAAGLVNDAVKGGYKAYFCTMEEVVGLLRQKEVSATALNGYSRLLKAHLVAIDDIMLFPVKRHEAVAFFNLINHLHEQTSLIITTNKSPKEWAETLEDEVLAAALLDRLLYRCEVVKLSGNSYRMENRKTIFQPDSENRTGGQ